MTVSRHWRRRMNNLDSELNEEWTKIWRTEIDLEEIKIKLSYAVRRYMHEREIEKGKLQIQLDMIMGENQALQRQIEEAYRELDER
jgi:hypothetical protein